jgi:hypothetical protein
MFNGRGAPYLMIGMVTRYGAGAYDVIELIRFCRYSRYSLTVHNGIQLKNYTL